MNLLRVSTTVVFLLFAISILAYAQSDKFSPKFPQPSTPRINPQEVVGESFLDIKNFSASSNTIDYGQEVTLNWTIKGRNMKNLKLELSPEVGAIPLSRTDYTNEDFTIEGSKKIRPSQTQQYTLKVSGIAPGTLGPQRGTGPGGLPGIGEKTFTDSKSLTINVKKVLLENEKPEVDQKKMKIKFIVKNTGNADFKGPLHLDYKVNSLSGAPLISGIYEAPNLTINAKGKVAVYEINIPDRQKALNEDGIVINVSIGADIYPSKSDLKSPSTTILAEKHTALRSSKLKEVDNDTYEHRWEVKRLTINNELINAFGEILTGSIKLNNFDGSKGAVLKHEPMTKTLDCYVEIMGNRQYFTIPRFEFSKGDFYHYRGYINNMSAFLSKYSFLIQDGTLKLRISFETGGTEIKGYEETWDFFHDLSAPDYNFTKFDIVLHFWIKVENGKLTLNDVSIYIDSKGDFTGAYDILLPEYLGRYFDIKVRGIMYSIIKNLLMSEPVRAKLEGKLQELITRNPSFNIYKLLNVRGELSEIFIEYIER